MTRLKTLAAVVAFLTLATVAFAQDTKRIVDKVLGANTTISVDATSLLIPNDKIPSHLGDATQHTFVLTVTRNSVGTPLGTFSYFEATGGEPKFDFFDSILKNGKVMCIYRYKNQLFVITADAGSADTFGGIQTTTLSMEAGDGKFHVGKDGEVEIEVHLPGKMDAAYHISPEPNQHFKLDPSGKFVKD